jgi:hypothetical protein
LFSLTPLVFPSVITSDISYPSVEGECDAKSQALAPPTTFGGVDGFVYDKPQHHTPYTGS